MRKPFSILNEQAANFSAVKASLEFSMIDWRYDMIDFAVPWDKQSILCLTNSRCYLLKETTYIEVKYLFEGLSKVLCYGIPYTLLHWGAHYSLRITICLYWSVQANRSVWEGIYNGWGCLYLIPYFATFLPRPAPQWSLVPLYCGPYPVSFHHHSFVRVLVLKTSIFLFPTRKPSSILQSSTPNSPTFTILIPVSPVVGFIPAL